MNSLELLDALANAGLLVQSLEYNKLVRVPTADKPRHRNGWYIAFEHPILMVVYGNWATDYESKYISRDKIPSRAEFAEIHRNIEKAKQARQREQAKEWAYWRNKHREVLTQCQPIAGTPAEKYLQNRGIASCDYPALCYHPRLDYWEDGKCFYYPAMIAKVTNPEGELITLHRTYITPDGYKADISTPKKLMKTAGSMAGASIKLGDPQPTPEGDLLLGIAEGIETALSASQLFGYPVWAGISTAGIKNFTPPANLSTLVFFADNDEAGLNSAREAGKRLAGMGISCLLKAPQAGDWNDELMNSIKA